MKIIKVLTLAALAAALLFQAPLSRADDQGVIRMTFQKCAVPGGADGTVDGDCGAGTVAVTYLSVVAGKGILRFSTEYTIETAAGCSFKALCDGGMDLRSGHFVLNGAVTEGSELGAQMQVRGQADATLTCSTGTITITPTEHRDATITWTKHVTAFLPPGGEIFGTIAGTAGGDLGEGTVIGDAFNPVEVLPDGSFTFEAEYHFVGSKHSLTVHFRTVQAPDNSGVITGVVTDGWLKGNVVVGHYTGRSCEEGVNHTCFDGVFTIKKGSKNNE